ncbi:MAG TPA: Asp-tRNA(Asn)/Glu-tRNA(Gln) amidotransferase GatCAB subunit B, partial [Solirubrobacteraceae bacterium]|nr:Asp-tRNA(Asn)/Glu-tRNA(Gln) amidotransferase GatCAB subunit B [Solirubrobacteraceae bacterium]
RLEQEVGLSADGARLFAFRAELGDYLEAGLAAGVDPAPPAQTLANWISGELLRRLPDGQDPGASRVTPTALAALVGLLAARRISAGAARQVLDRLLAEGGDPLRIVQEEGLAALDGADGELAAIVAAALAANAEAAENVRAGNAKAIGPIVGYVMRETKGRADGGEVTRLVHEQLGL